MQGPCFTLLWTGARPFEGHQAWVDIGHGGQILNEEVAHLLKLTGGDGFFLPVTQQYLAVREGAGNSSPSLAEPAAHQREPRDDMQGRDSGTAVPARLNTTAS
jgi:hypothetical protein